MAADISEAMKFKFEHSKTNSKKNRHFFPFKEINVLK